MKLEFIAKYSIMAVPGRKQIALVRNERNCSHPIAYFRTAKEAGQFKCWLESLLDSDANGWRKGWEDGAFILKEG